MILTQNLKTKNPISPGVHHWAARWIRSRRTWISRLRGSDLSFPASPSEPMLSVQQQLDALSHRVKMLEQKLLAAPGVSRVVHDKEYDRVLAHERRILDSYDSHQSLSKEDRAALTDVRKRKAELKVLLNIKY